MEQTVLCGYSQELTPGSNFKGHESIVNLILYLFKINLNITVALRLLLPRFLPFSFSTKNNFPSLTHIYYICHLSFPAFAPLNVCFKNSLTQMKLLKHHAGYTHNVLVFPTILNVRSDFSSNSIKQLMLVM
jgi:hypothetical protein